MTATAKTVLAWMGLAALVAVPLHLAWHLVAGAFGSALDLAIAVQAVATYCAGAMAGYIVTRVSS